MIPRSLHACPGDTAAAHVLVRRRRTQLLVLVISAIAQER
jgi:hypothetical protein